MLTLSMQELATEIAELDKKRDELEAELKKVFLTILFRSKISGSVLRGAYVLYKCVYLFSIIFL